MRSDTSHSGVIHDWSSSARLRRTRRRTTSDDQVSESTIANATMAHRPSAIDQRLALRRADIPPRGSSVGASGDGATRDGAGALVGGGSTTRGAGPELVGASRTSGVTTLGAV